ncbi:hypothetical protein CRE_30478 [Caenorhabditis remanei]|uniref:CUB-like domain-containing protein n=1 Tax=Caenorhabditis remanei TaxID=31234 RepID=E3NGJ6_CAERE|nr:hypothetical protein CRE_30478 [Caenorhabditis remanei]
MPTLFLLLFLILVVSADPQTFYLKNHHSRTPPVYDVESGANLYLASNDDWMYLKNITFKTGNNTYTLEKLLVPNDDGSAASIPVAGDFSIYNTNNETVTRRLTGFFYITTALQTQDPTFHVFVLQTTQSVRVTGISSTVVILNTGLINFTDYTEPTMTSYVTNINQSPNTNLYFHWGMPYDDWKSQTNNTFFQNPIVYLVMMRFNTHVSHRFFDHVEPLQVGLDYWYFTVDGPVNMYMENKYVRIDNYNTNTTATSTTGVMISTYLFVECSVEIRPIEYGVGVAGYIITTFMDDDGSMLDIELFYDDFYPSSYNDYQCNNIGVLYFDYQQAYSVTVRRYEGGTFYLQYFNFAGDVWQTSTVGNKVTSTTPVATTHKNGSAAVFAIKFVVFVLMASLLS